MMGYQCKTSDLYPRGKGKIFCFRYKDYDGDWKEKSTGTSKKREAQDRKRRFERTMEAGQKPTDMADWTLAAAEEWWIEHRKPPVIEESTWNSERYKLQHLVRVLGEKRRLREINNLLVDRYVRARMDDGVSSWTIKKELFLWHKILDKANLYDALRRHWPKLKVKSSDIGKALTRDELRHLVEVASTDWRWIVALYADVLAANTGMRGGEIKKLKVGLVDLAAKQLLIRRDASKTDGRGFNIPLNADAREAAARLLERYQAICKKLNVEPSPDHYLLPFNWSRVQFGSDKGKRGYDPTHHQVDWGTAWSSLRTKAGHPTLRFHDLRHTFITHMVERGIPIERIQTMVGQLSARMVRHYTHISSGVLQRDVSVLDEEPILVLPAVPTEDGVTIH